MKFPKLVIEEATALREHATKNEISHLSFENLEPSSKSECIYGQLTGDCYSPRATRLIEQCARRVYKGFHGVNITTKKDLNGSPINKSRYEYWSPIEVFIARENDDQEKLNAKLISFIKGEIKTL